MRGKLGIDMKVVVVCVGGEWMSQYGDWEMIRGVEESECVLVRPDRFSTLMNSITNRRGDMGEMLEKVLRTILSR